MWSEFHLESYKNSYGGAAEFAQKKGVTFSNALLDSQMWQFQLVKYISEPY